MTTIVRPYWLPVAGRLAIPRAGVDVWALALDRRQALGESLADLAPDEIERARRFRFDADRRRFAASRAGLRRLLAAYLDVPPCSLVFNAGPRGKPCLDPATHGAGLRFNVSHSDGVALIAVAGRREVGVDVERVRPLPRLDDVIARFFPPGERDRLFGLAAPDRLRAFFRSWTLKEAYLKGTGEGMSGRLDQLEVHMGRGRAVPILRVLDRSAEESRWDLTPVPISRHYVAAVALEHG